MYDLVPVQIYVRDLDNLKSTNIVLSKRRGAERVSIGIDEYIELIKNDNAPIRLEENLESRRRKGESVAINKYELEEYLRSIPNTGSQDTYKMVLSNTMRFRCKPYYILVHVDGEKTVGISIDNKSKRVFLQTDVHCIKYISMLTDVFGAIGLIEINNVGNDKIKIPRLNIKRGELACYQDEIEINIDSYSRETDIAEDVYSSGAELDINDLLETEGIEKVNIRAEYIGKVIANTDRVKGKSIILSRVNKSVTNPGHNSYLGTLDISNRDIGKVIFRTLMESSQREKLIMNNCEIGNISDLFAILNFAKFKSIEAYNINVVDKETERWKDRTVRFRRADNIDMLTDRSIAEDLKRVVDTRDILYMSLEEYNRMIRIGQKLCCSRPESARVCIVYK